MIRVGRTHINRSACKYDKFTPIMVTTASRSGRYKALSPYYLLNEKGQNMENIWQFSKIYKWVPTVSIPVSNWNPAIAWEWPQEVHLRDDTPTEEYYLWRESGKNCPYPIRYPVGYKHRGKCVGAYRDVDDDVLEGPLDYIESRKAIYLPEYVRLAKKVPIFQELKERVSKGENLLIIDVDGPVEDSMPYYQDKYKVPDDWINLDSVSINEENLRILLNDEKHPFGHGFCLAAALMDLDKKI